MARKQTVGARFEADEKSAGKTPLKTAAQIAALEQSAAAEKFPTDLRKAFALLAEINAEQVSTQAEWEEKQPRLKALKLHIHKLQQGLPLVETKSGDINHAHMTNVLAEMKLKGLARTSPEVAAMIRENVTLKAANETLTAENAALKAPKA